jgi:predicted PurR-regulated permease PerM
MRAVVPLDDPDSESQLRAAQEPAAIAPAQPPTLSVSVAAPARRSRWLLPQAAAFILLIAAIYLGKALLLPVLIAVLLTLLLRPIVAGLLRLHIPEALGAAVVILTLLATIVALLSQLYGPAQRWTQLSERDLTVIREKFAMIQRPMEAVRAATEKVTGDVKSAVTDKPSEALIERSSVLAAMGQTQSFLVSAATCLILLFFLLGSGDLFLRKLVRVLPRFRDKMRAVEISRTVQADIGHYFATVTMVNVGLGVVTTLVMLALGMPNPPLWGVMVGVFNFVPYVGPLASLAVLTLAAVLSFDAWQQILAVPLAFAIITLLEGNLVQPIVIGRRLSINPVVIFLSVMTWGWLWGIGGIFVAVPMLVVIKICADHIPAMASIGEFIDNE